MPVDELPIHVAGPDQVPNSLPEETDVGDCPMRELFRRDPRLDREEDGELRPTHAFGRPPLAQEAVQLRGGRGVMLGAAGWR